MFYREKPIKSLELKEHYYTTSGQAEISSPSMSSLMSHNTFYQLESGLSTLL